jgi:FkbM family methyltransferase
MLISLKEIKEKYNLEFKNIIHIGAHKAEELNDYVSAGIKKVVWVEANPTLVNYLKTILRGPYATVLHAAVSNKDDEEIHFKITNNGQSSSILELGIHKSLFPGVSVAETIMMKTKTLKTLFEENKIDIRNYDFMNIDIQGAELMALQGLGEDLKHLKAIYTEVNTDYVYKDCSLINEIDDYLSLYGFKRIATEMWPGHPWGDALYVKE